MTNRIMTFGKDNWPTDYPGDNNSGSDKVTGTTAPNIINGGRGNDTIDGRAGDDTIRGGPGKDTMTGGPGFDTFLYGSQNDHSVQDSSAINPDVITDYNPDEDIIDLHLIDADATMSGLQHFNWIFDHTFSGKPAELRADPNTGRLEGDVDGDGKADLVIQSGSGQIPTGPVNVAFAFVPGGNIPPPHIAGLHL